LIGFLNSASPGPWAPFVAAFQQGLGETGYVDGQNVAIEYRWAEDGLPDDMPPPDDDLHVEQMSLPFLRRILASVKDEAELDQARSDWKLISGLAEGANVINWDGLKGTLSRHMRRNLRKHRLPSPPPAVDYLLACWRDFTARAILLPFLIFIRRSPDHSRNLSHNLALAAIIASRSTATGRTQHHGSPEDRP
jgi:hypothetical protein